jgi:hypothetical protein
VELLPPDIDTAFGIDTTKAGFSPAFLLGQMPASHRPLFGECRGERCLGLFFGRCEKNFALHATFGHDPILWFRRLVGQ